MTYTLVKASGNFCIPNVLTAIRACARDNTALLFFIYSSNGVSRLLVPLLRGISALIRAKQKRVNEVTHAPAREKQKNHREIRASSALFLSRKEDDNTARRNQK